MQSNLKAGVNFQFLWSRRLSPSQHGLLVRKTKPTPVSSSPFPVQSYSFRFPPAALTAVHLFSPYIGNSFLKTESSLGGMYYCFHSLRQQTLTTCWVNAERCQRGEARWEEGQWEPGPVPGQPCERWGGGRPGRAASWFGGHFCQPNWLSQSDVLCPVACPISRFGWPSAHGWGGALLSFQGAYFLWDCLAHCFISLCVIFSGWTLFIY